MQQEERVVGVALKREKRKKHISDKLIRQAAEAGVTLRFVDKDVPLEQQGPFVAILQKVRKPGEPAGLPGWAQAAGQGRSRAEWCQRWRSSCRHSCAAALLPHVAAALPPRCYMPCCVAV